MFQHILVPLDGSELAERVMPHVVAMAKTRDIPVSLISVLDPTQNSSQAQSVDALDWQLRKSEVDVFLQSWASRLKELDVKVETSVLEGLAADQIIQYADHKGVDLIMLSSHGRSGLSEWNVSSIVQKVILMAASSTMIIRSHQPAKSELNGLKYRRILLPIDCSQRAEVVLPAATLLARAHEAKLILSHVVQRPEMPRRTPLTPEDMDLSKRILERNQAEAEPYLKELQERLGVDVETRLLVSGGVSVALHELVDQEEIDLVILSAHGYSGESRFPYGNVVISFISYGMTPLLIIQDMPRPRFRPVQEDLQYHREEKPWQINSGN